MNKSKIGGLLRLILMNNNKAVGICDDCLECEYHRHESLTCRGKSKPCSDFVSHRYIEAMGTTLYDYLDDEYGY